VTALPDEAAAFLRECCGDQWSVEPLPGDGLGAPLFPDPAAGWPSQMLAYYSA